MARPAGVFLFAALRSIVAHQRLASSNVDNEM